MGDQRGLGDHVQLRGRLRGNLDRAPKARSPREFAALARVGQTLRAYRETFRRHRMLLIAPILLAAVIAAWFTLGAPPSYRSTAALWVDNGPSISSSVGGALTLANLTASANAVDPSMGGPGGPSSGAPVAPLGPAGLESEVVSELLLTPAFDLAVARDSLLPRFLASGGSAGGFSPSVLLAGGTHAVPQRLADGAAAASLATDLKLMAAGPQLLELSYDGPSPVVSRSVLQSMIRQLGAAGSAFSDSIGKKASAFYEQELAAATSAVAGNRGALAGYAQAHPHATITNDATFRALSTEVGLAEAQRASVQAATSQADKEAQGNGGSATMKVIDPPSLPSGPVRSMSSKLTGVIGGAFAGVVLSLLALILLTPRAKTRWDAEVPLFARLVAWDRRGRA
jgi:uncharacterized protein involved in exopolysaccharide biosynthesis